MDYKDFLIREKKPSEQWLIDLEEGWAKIEQKYNIKFFLRDGTPRPVTEWLDDLYLRFDSYDIENLLKEIMMNGDILFANILKHKQ